MSRPLEECASNVPALVREHGWGRDSRDSSYLPPDGFPVLSAAQRREIGMEKSAAQSLRDARHARGRLLQTREVLEPSRLQTQVRTRRAVEIDQEHLDAPVSFPHEQIGRL